MTDMRNQDTERLLSIDGIGEAMAKDVVEFSKKNIMSAPSTACLKK